MEMEMKTCPACGAEYSAELEACPECGATDAATMEWDKNEYAPEQFATAEETKIFSPVGDGASETPPAKEKQPPKKWVIISLIAAGVAVLGICIAVLVYILGAEGRSMDDARELADEGEFLQAYQLIDGIDGADADELRDEICDSMEKEVTTLIKDKHYGEAFEKLEAYSFLPEHDELYMTLVSSCSHKFKETSVVKADCKTEGTRTMQCTLCKKTETETIPAKSHTLCEKITQAACKSEGLRVTYCSVCDYKMSETIPATGHDFEVTKVIRTSCTETGERIFTCSKCGETKSEEIAPSSHSGALMCTEDSYCITCGEWLAKAAGHSFSGVSCTDAGVCGRCGEKGTETLPHNYNEDHKCTMCKARNPEHFKTVKIGDTFELSRDGMTFSVTLDGIKKDMSRVYERDGKKYRSDSYNLLYTVTNTGDIATENDRMWVTSHYPREKDINPYNSTSLAVGEGKLDVGESCERTYDFTYVESGVHEVAFFLVPEGTEWYREDPDKYVVSVYIDVSLNETEIG